MTKLDQTCIAARILDLGEYIKYEGFGMKHETRKSFALSVAAAAAAGLLGAACVLNAQGAKSPGKSSSTTPATKGKTSGGGGAKACCKGMNACKNKGGCHVEGKHACHGLNACEGQGGCNGHCPK